MSASHHAACVSLPISYDVKQREPKLEFGARWKPAAPSGSGGLYSRPFPRQPPFFALLQLADKASGAA